jgi:hypothetical protein
MQFLEIINNNATAIEAIVAVLNLILISLLTYRGYTLQNKVQSMELFSKTQQESLFCQNLISDFIVSFEQRAFTTSSYLKTLYDVGAGDPPYEELAQHYIEEYNSILENLRNMKVSFQEACYDLTPEKLSDKVLRLKSIEITHLKVFLSTHSPVTVFNYNLDGPSSIWLDDEHKYNLAFTETKKVLIEINKKIEALT